MTATVLYTLVLVGTPIGFLTRLVLRRLRPRQHRLPKTTAEFDRQVAALVRELGVQALQELRKRGSNRTLASRRTTSVAEAEPTSVRQETAHQR